MEFVHKVRSDRRRRAALAGATAAVVLVPSVGGCSAIGGIFGGGAESYLRQSTREVPARYEGLRGKSFAVIVAADRITQADYPTVVGDLTLTISRRLADPANGVGASGYVPGERVLEYLYNNPRWVAMTPEELGREMGVERVVFIDLQEFRLTDPGNQYLWAGVAAGTVRVVEVDSKTPGVYALQEPVRVTFPDEDGYGPAQIPARNVQLALSKRFVDRAAWLFYKHEEPYYPKY